MNKATQSNSNDQAKAATLHRLLTHNPTIATIVIACWCEDITLNKDLLLVLRNAIRNIKHLQGGSRFARAALHYAHILIQQRLAFGSKFDRLSILTESNDKEVELDFETVCKEAFKYVFPNKTIENYIACNLTNAEVVKLLDRLNLIYTTIQLINAGLDIVKDLNSLFSNEITNIKEVLERFKTANERIIEILAHYEDFEEDEVILTSSNLMEQVLTTQQNEQKRINIASLPFLDKYSLIQSGRLVLFGAPTNHGKTTILTSISASTFRNISANLAYYRQRLNIPESYKLGIVFFTFEESTHDIRKRILMNLLDIDNHVIRDMDSKTLESYLDKVQLSEEVVLCIKYYQALTTSPTEMQVYLEKLKMQKHIWPVLVCVDYIDKVKPETSFGTEVRHALFATAIELRHLALKYNIPVLTATQLNRESIQGKVSDGLRLDKIAEAWTKAWEADAIVLLKQLDISADDKNYFLVSIPKSRMSARVMQPFVIDAQLHKSKVIGTIVAENLDEFLVKVQNNDLNTLENNEEIIFSQDIEQNTAQNNNNIEIDEIDLNTDFDKTD